MNSLILSALLVFPVVGQTATQPSKEQDGRMPVCKIDGEWTTVYCEMDGKKVESKNVTKVTIKDNVVTCQHDGKEKSWRLEFGPHHMIRTTETNGPADKQTASSPGAHTHHGVYIASEDYFCLCLNKGQDRRSESAPREPGKEREQGKGREQGGTPDRFGAGHHPYGSGLVLILRRTSAASASAPQRP